MGDRELAIMTQEDARALSERMAQLHPDLEWEAAKMRCDAQGWFGSVLTWAAQGAEQHRRLVWITLNPARATSKYRAQICLYGDPHRVKEEWDGDADDPSEAYAKATALAGGRWEDEAAHLAHCVEVQREIVAKLEDELDSARTVLAEMESAP